MRSTWDTDIDCPLSEHPDINCSRSPVRHHHTLLLLPYKTTNNLEWPRRHLHSPSNMYRSMNTESTQSLNTVLTPRRPARLLSTRTRILQTPQPTRRIRLHHFLLLPTPIPLPKPAKDLRDRRLRIPTLLRPAELLVQLGLLLRKLDFELDGRLRLLAALGVEAPVGFPCTSSRGPSG